MIMSLLATVVGRSVTDHCHLIYIYHAQITYVKEIEVTHSRGTVVSVFAEMGGRIRSGGSIRFMPADIDIERVAYLARIALTDNELAEYSEQLVHILEHAERVQALPTDGVAPTSHPLPMVNAFRHDIVTESLDRDDALAGAPDSENSYFRVPKILDES